MFWISAIHSRPNLTSSVLGDLNIKIGQTSTCICLNIHVNSIWNSSILNLYYCRMSIKLDLEFDQNNVRIIANEINKLFSKLSRKPIYFILRKMMPVSIIIKAVYKLPIFQVEKQTKLHYPKKGFWTTQSTFGLNFLPWDSLLPISCLSSANIKSMDKYI